MELTASESKAVTSTPDPADAPARMRQLGLFEEEEATTIHEPARALPGELGFASPEVQQQRRAELLGEGALVVSIPTLPADRRGHLAEHVDERIERELAARGAPSPYLASWSSMPDDVEARLADQLFRARSVGACGIALLLGSIAAEDGTLTPEDSATVRFFARCTAERPLVLLVDDADRHVRGYEEPVPIATWLTRRVEVVTPPPVSVAPVVIIEAADEDEDEDEDDAVEAVPSIDAIEAIAEAQASEETAEAAAEDEDDEEILGEVVEDEESLAVELRAAEADAQAEAEAHAEDVTEHAEADVTEEAHADAEAHADVTDEAHADVTDEAHADVTDEAHAEPTHVEPTPDDARAQRAMVGVPVVRARDAWRPWALALSAARGPQPLGAFEKLFTESYMPLANAIAEGLDDPRALRAHDEFRRAFERAYLDASATFGVTTRRPRMVMDAFDLALKHARAHNARSTQVLVVDSYRQDLGVHARDALARLGQGRVSLTSESLLWSAMPTTTVRQLETLARGVDALRAPAQGEPPPESLRGRTAEHARRLRVGSREIWKLDVVPSLLAQATRGVTCAEDIASVLPAVGEAIAVALLRHVASLPARTLLFVVGDHGFTVDRRGRLGHGGASPEEVLVPAQAWLVGDLH